MDIDLSECWVNGIRPFADMPRGALFMETLKNLQASERKGKPLLEPEYPAGFQEDVGTWPHFAVHREDDVVLVTSVNAVYPVDTSAVETGTALGLWQAVDTESAYTVTGSGLWRMTAFQGYWFLSNGTDLLFSLPHAADSKVCGIGGSVLNAAFVANWNNRLVLGGLSGSALSNSAFTAIVDLWRSSEHKLQVTGIDMTFDDRWVLVGPDLGGDNTAPHAAIMALLGAPCRDDPADPYDLYYEHFEAEVRTWVRSGALQLVPCRSAGPLLAGMQHGPDFMVYGRDGAVRLSEVENGVADEVSLDVGIVGRGAVNGLKKSRRGQGPEHCIAAADGEVYMRGERGQRYSWAQPVGDGWVRLGYDATVGTLDSPVVSFDPVEQHYWFADADDCYGLSRTGLYRSLAVRPTSVIRLDGLIGAFKADVDQSVAFRTHLFDGGRSEPFIIQQIDIRTTDRAADPDDRWKLGLAGRRNKADALKEFPMVLADTRGRVTPNLSVIDAVVKGEAADRTEVDADALGLWIGRGNASSAAWLS